MFNIFFTGDNIFFTGKREEFIVKREVGNVFSEENIGHSEGFFVAINVLDVNHGSFTESREESVVVT